MEEGLEIIRGLGRSAVGWLAPGEPAEAILRQASLASADLVVVGLGALATSGGPEPESVSRRLLENSRKAMLLAGAQPVSANSEPAPACTVIRSSKP
jgi:hypothetical protein